MSWLSELFSKPSRPAPRTTSAKDPLVIPSPRLGFWNVLGPTAAPLVVEDRAALSPIFATTLDGVDSPPTCDVLLVYCRVGPDGRIVGSPHSLRDAIWISQAPIAVIAAENPPESYIAAAGLPGRGRANLVMTVERRGQAFPSFFQRLFGAMQRGTTMPTAWVQLAPQIPGRDHPDCPGTLFACEAGHVAFGGP